MRLRTTAGLSTLTLAAFLVGGFVDDRWGVPFGMLNRLGSFRPRQAPPLPGQSAYVPWYSNARGGEDAPRAEVRAGRAIDMKRCVTTMTMRQETVKEANEVCAKIVTGLGE